MADISTNPQAAESKMSDCDREQIQFLGAVQSFGCLLVMASDWTIRNASTNTDAILGIGVDKLIGTRLTDHLSPDAMHSLRGKLTAMGASNEGGRMFDIDLAADGRRFDVAMHRLNQSYVMEIERKSTETYRDDMAVVEPLFARARSADSIEKMCEMAARGLQALSGFGRVMVYRFNPDESGTVIAETRLSSMDSYRGLHFPASDIPAQARALYTRSLLRIIPDVDAPTAPIVPQHDLDGSPVDLSLAITRAVSPVHLEYLRNMDVRASMSASILRDGRLWGLIACHNPEPHYIDFETRSAVELFVRLLSYELSLREEQTQNEATARAHELHERLVMLFEIGLDFDSGIEALAREIGELIAFDGMAYCSGGRLHASGTAPDGDELIRLETHLARVPASRVFTTNHLEGTFPGAVAPEHGIGGLMALPLRREPQFLMLFRKEIAQNVVWAGNPKKPVEIGQERISPRKSFAAWKVIVRGRSEAWTQSDRRAAEVLRVTLLELALKHAGETNASARQRIERQEILISELNHRLRNIFDLVGGIVAATEQPTEAVQDYAATAEARIRALARANDQLTQSRSGNFRLSELIHAEAEAFVGDSTRFHFKTGDVALPAIVRPTLVLVVHELVTNSAKYGALQAETGIVEVDVEPDERGGAWFDWRERGGAPVSAPPRAGFGTTLIQQLIPHELGGEAHVTYLRDGLHARFYLPADHIEKLLTGAVRLSEPARHEGLAPIPTITGQALVVEDNLIAAMNASDVLRRLGADDVLIASSRTEALALIEANDFALAVLDVNLGGESSEGVAEALRTRRVPFLLATGYDDVGRKGAYADAPLLTKPFSNDGVTAALRRL